MAFRKGSGSTKKATRKDIDEESRPVKPATMTTTTVTTTTIAEESPSQRQRREQDEAEKAGEVHSALTVNKDGELEQKHSESA